MPAPSSPLGFTPGELVGCVGGRLGLDALAERLGFDLVVTSDKEGPGCAADAALEAGAEVVVSQPFWPYYLTKARMERAPNLKLAVTAGVGSDHVDLASAAARGVDVAEVTQSNSSSVAEHAVMQALALVRNFVPSYAAAASGRWDIAGCVAHAYDIEGMSIGSVGLGRIGHGIFRRLAPFGVKELHYTEKGGPLPEGREDFGATYHSSVEDMVPHCDIVFVNCPLHPETDHLFDHALLERMRRGSYLVNTARGRICCAESVAAALESGRLAGYAGDVWWPQPAPASHPWRTMPRHAMTPHVSGSTLSAQARYAAGVHEILEAYFGAGGGARGHGWPAVYDVVKDGELAGVGRAGYTPGDMATAPDVGGAR